MAPLERKTGSSLWRQVAEALVAELARGSLAPGDRLPTEPELMRRFGVSRFTTRQALASLEARGLVRAEQGRGTFVHSGPLDYPISARTRFSRNLIEQGLEPGGELLVHEIVPATDAVAERLRLLAGAAVIHRRGLGTAGGVPIELADSFYSAERFPDFATVRQRHATLTATFAAYGIDDYSRLRTEIEARMPTRDEARLLRQPTSVPVLAVKKIDVDCERVPFCYSEALWSAERVMFTIGGEEP